MLSGAGSDETADACDAFGIEAPEKRSEITGIYPENWQAVVVFRAMASQWHSGMNGKEGLRYEALPVIEERLGVKKRHRADLFEALQIMEGEALNVWAEQRK